MKSYFILVDAANYIVHIEKERDESAPPKVKELPAEISPRGELFHHVSSFCTSVGRNGEFTCASASVGEEEGADTRIYHLYRPQAPPPVAAPSALPKRKRTIHRTVRIAAPAPTMNVQDAKRRLKQIIRMKSLRLQK